MANFNLARLNGGISAAKFDADDGDIITIYYHHATPEEIAIAYERAGLSVDDTGAASRSDNGQRDPFALAPVMAHALTELAALCIERVIGLDDWPTSARIPDVHGLTTLSEGAVAVLPRPIRKQIGQLILESSRISLDEGKPSAP